MSRKKQTAKSTSKKAAKGKLAADDSLGKSAAGGSPLLELEWRPRAALDRESIALFLGVECGNPQAALSAVQRINEAIDRIRLLPDSGGRVRFDSLANKEYRTVMANPYTVYYRFDENKVTIYRILHQRRSIDDYSLVDLQF